MHEINFSKLCRLCDTLKIRKIRDLKNRNKTARKTASSSQHKQQNVYDY